MDEDAIKLAEKTKQVYSILGRLWNERIQLLEHYINGRRSMFKKTTFTSIIERLSTINKRERKVQQLISDHVGLTKKNCEQAIQDLLSAGQQETESIQILIALSELFGRYAILEGVHKEILAIEERLINSYSESDFKEYLRKIEFFAQEFSSKNHFLDEQKKKVDVAIAALGKLRHEAQKGSVKDIVLPSFVNGLFRVGIANGIGITITSFAHSNAIVVLNITAIFMSTIISLIDYRTNVFTITTQKVVKLTRNAFA